MLVRRQSRIGLKTSLLSDSEAEAEDARKDRCLLSKVFFGLFERVEVEGIWIMRQSYLRPGIRNSFIRNSV